MQVAVALRIHRRTVGVGQGQAAHTRLLQGQQFAGIGQAVAVRILPDSQAGKGRVRGIDAAIEVRIELGQRVKAIGPPGAAARVVAEQFAAIVDPAIPVPVEHQQPVIRPHPAGALGKAVLVMVEVDVEVLPQRLHPVAIEIEDEGGADVFGKREPIFQAAHEIPEPIDWQRVGDRVTDIGGFGYHVRQRGCKCTSIRYSQTRSKKRVVIV